MDEINIMIEPHYDDIWLSCGNYILKNPKKKFVLISVGFSDLNSSFNMKLLMQYCPQIIKIIDMHHPDYEWKYREKQVLKTYEEFVEQNKRYLAKFDMEREFVERGIAKFISVYKDSKKKVFIPMGIQHPMHAVVSYLCIFDGSEDIYIYQDVPYGFKNKFAFLIPEFVKRNNLELFYENDGSNNTKKFEIFKVVYSSQFFLRESCENSQERIYKKGKLL